MKKSLRSIIVIATILMPSAALGQTPHAELMSSTTNIVCTNSASMTCRELKIWRINDEKGNEHANTVIQLDKNTQLATFQITVCDINGKEIKRIKKNDLIKSEYSENLASDAYYLFTDFTPPTYPIIVSIETEERISGGFTSFPSFWPQTDRDTEVHNAHYKLTLPPHMQCRIHKVNTSWEVVESTDEKGQKVYEVSVDSVPPLSGEDFAPSWRDIAPRIYFAPMEFEYLNTHGSMASWKDFGLWQWSMLQDRRVLPDDAKKKVHELTDTCLTTKAKVAALYHFLANSTRYVSIQLGIGGLRPFGSDYVWKTGFGDCKALSNYMCALLQEAGIDAKYTVISTENKRVPEEFATSQFFNHVVCAVPEQNDTLWIESTNPTLPLGYIHEDIAGHNAVLIDSSGGVLVSLPKYADSLNWQNNNLAVTLTTDGQATMRLLQQSGMRQYEHAMPLAKTDQKSQRDAMTKYLSIPGATIQEMTVNDIKEDYNTPHIDISTAITAPRYASVSGSRMFIPLCPLHQDVSTLPRDDKRKNDIDVKFGYLDSDTIIINIPDGYHVEALPPSIDMQSDFGSFSFGISQEGNIIKVHNRLLVKSGRFDKSKYEELRSFRNVVSKMYRQKVVVVKD